MVLVELEHSSRAWVRLVPSLWRRLLLRQRVTPARAAERRLVAGAGITWTWVDTGRVVDPEVLTALDVAALYERLRALASSERTDLN